MRSCEGKTFWMLTSLTQARRRMSPQQGLKVAEENVAQARHGEVVLQGPPQVVLGADDLDLADGQFIPGDEEEIGAPDGEEEPGLEAEQEEDVLEAE